MTALLRTQHLPFTRFPKDLEKYTAQDFEKAGLSLKAPAPLSGAPASLTVVPGVAATVLTLNSDSGLSGSGYLPMATNLSGTSTGHMFYSNVQLIRDSSQLQIVSSSSWMYVYFYNRNGTYTGAFSGGMNMAGVLHGLTGFFKFHR